MRLFYSRIIWWAAAFQLLTGGLGYWAWKATGNQVWLSGYFHYQGAIYFILLDTLTLWLCIVVWQEFKQREPLGRAWLVISIAMLFRLAGDLMKHWLGMDTYINPLHYAWRVWNTPTASLMDLWGGALAGPVFMVVLAAGLYRGLQHYKKTGMLGRLRDYDWILVGAAAIYAADVIATVLHDALSNISPIRTGWVLTWPIDLILAILLFEAILLLRTSVDMGAGYIARVWEAFAVAIMLTSVESLAHWLTAYGYFPYPENSILWYIWFIWTAAFAMGPAYQVDAIRLAKGRAGDSLDSNHLPPLMRISPRSLLR